jgi:8-oxoguanine deaminase
MVGGEWRVEEAQPLGVDVARLRAEHGEAAKRFLETL